MKWLLFVPVALAAAIALIALVGALLPRAHVASRRGIYRQTPATLYALVRDFAGQPAWRSGLKAVELLPAREGCVCYRETSKHGAITFLVLRDQPGRELVVEIADPELPFGGTWIFEFTAAPGGGTELRITERGEVKNVIFRVLARFVFGHTATLETYLRDLGRKVGENITPT